MLSNLGVFLIRDLIGVPLDVNDLVSVGANTGAPLVGKVVSLPSGLTVAGQENQPPMVMVQVMIPVLVDQNGQVALVKTAGQPIQENTSTLQ